MGGKEARVVFATGGDTATASVQVSEGWGTARGHGIASREGDGLERFKGQDGLGPLIAGRQRRMEDRRTVPGFWLGLHGWWVVGPFPRPQGTGEGLGTGSQGFHWGLAESKGLGTLGPPWRGVVGTEALRVWHSGEGVYSPGYTLVQLQVRRHGGRRQETACALRGAGAADRRGEPAKMVAGQEGD